MKERRRGREDFAAFAQAAIPALHRLAVAAARDQHLADDLVQTALEKVYVAWPRIGRQEGAPLAYARNTLIRGFLNETRRSWWRRVQVTDDLPERGAPDGAVESTGERWLVREALAELTPRQRIAVCLRHLDGLSVRETALVMGIAESNVKAATREGLSVLKERLAPAMRGTEL